MSNADKLASRAHLLAERLSRHQDVFGIYVHLLAQEQPDLAERILNETVQVMSDRLRGDVG